MRDEEFHTLEALNEDFDESHEIEEQIIEKDLLLSNENGNIENQISLMEILDNNKDEKLKILDNDEDERVSILGYTPIFERTLDRLDSILASMGALYFIGGVQAHFTTAYAAGGELPTLTNWVLISILVLCIAASLAEVCALYPLCSAVYYWAFKTGGKKWGPFFAWTCAILNLAAWSCTTVTDAFGATKLIMSEPILFENQFPSNVDSIQYRAIQFGMSIVILLFAAIINLFPHRHLWMTIRLTAFMMLLLYIINMVWLPVGVSTTYGFHSVSQVFTTTENSNGAPGDPYNWFVNVLFPMYSLVGFDSAGHLSEETHQAHTNAPEGMFRGTLYSAILAFPLVLMYLFCFPGFQLLKPIGKLANPLTGMYYLAFGKSGQLFVVALSIILFVMNSVLCMLAASRLIFAMARDGLFPAYFKQIDKNGEPKGSIILAFIISSTFLVTVLPSESAYNSLTSAAVICFLASFLTVLFGRIFITGTGLKQRDWNLGKWSFWITLFALIGCTYTILCLVIPQTFPMEPANLNYSSVILIFLILVSTLSWRLTRTYRIGLSGTFKHRDRGPEKEAKIITVQHDRSLESETKSESDAIYHLETSIDPVESEPHS